MNARRALGALSALFILTAFFFLRPPGEPGVPFRDFSAYYSAGSTWLHGADPYSTAIAQTEGTLPGARPDLGEMLPYFGMPAALPLFALFARMPYGIAGAVWVTFIVGMMTAMFFSLRSLLRLTHEQSVYTALLLISFVPMTSGITLGQSALPAYAAVIVSLALIAAPALSSAGIIVAALQPSSALGLLALLTERRGWIAVGSSAIIIYILGVWAAGFAWPLHFARVLVAAAGAERFDLIQYTPASILSGFGVPERIAASAGLTIVSLAAAFAAFAVRRTSSVIHRVAIIGAATPFFTGFFHEHNFIVLVLPMLLCLLAARRTWLAIVACSLVSLNWLDFAQQPQGMWQDCMLALAFLCACGALSRGGVAAVSIVFIAVGAYVGTHHPLPIWPNDMTPLHAPIGASAAEVWKQEQLQTGLLRPDAAAALLRTFALLGSALLCYLMLNIDVHEIVERRD